MAQIYSIKAYKNTGFNSTDRPAKVSVLELAENVVFPSNYLRQNNELVFVRVESTWDVVKDIDYINIGESYYLVNGINMLSDHTAEISLTLDPILTAGGIDNLTIVDGWAERAHVSNDTIFSNNLPEPWQPSGPLKIDGPNKLQPQEADYNVYSLDGVLSTVDILKQEANALLFTVAASNESVVVPEIAGTEDTTSFSIENVAGEGFLGYVYPLSALYNTKNRNVKNGIKAIRSLGIDTSLVKAYKIPSQYISEITGFYYDENDNRVTVTIQAPNADNFADFMTMEGFSSVRGKRITNRPTLPYKYSSNIKNNKVFSLFNDYHIISNVSGDEAEFPAHDIENISSGETSPAFVVYADMGPDGKPYCQPVYYEGTATKPFMKAIAGAPWLAQPLGMQFTSGYAISEAMVKRNQTQGALNGLFSFIEEIGQQENAAGLAGALVAAGSVIQNGGVPTPSGFAAGLGAAFGTESKFLNRKNERIDTRIRKNITTPEIKFPVDPSLQGYIGNGFYVYRVRLNNNDLERFDKFLTQFGYSVDTKFEKAMMNNRQYFNYIKTSGANIKAAGAPLRITSEINALFDSGVRLWHVLPNASAMENNPIKEN